LDAQALAAELQADGWAVLQVASRAGTRASYLRRPDLGRRLDENSARQLAAAAASTADLDVALVVGDGLSAIAAQQHAVSVLGALRDALGGELTLAPVVVATQARVALSDEVGAVLGARVVLMLLGERPGLSSPDSLGAYLTHAPQVGCTDAQRNCVSNIRPAGLAPAQAAARIAWLLREALRRRLSGVALKDDSATEMLPKTR
ncbi:MAG: ethanolamine ammonia-lyase subunit EutC, partial [Chitinophagaceae bacterium]|nr:ethanolamine ammonia-lyase subunit EutC [Rubrivivax sp.]